MRSGPKMKCWVDCSEDPCPMPSQARVRWSPSSVSAVDAASDMLNASSWSWKWMIAVFSVSSSLVVMWRAAKVKKKVKRSAPATVARIQLKSAVLTPSFPRIMKDDVDGAYR